MTDKNRINVSERWGCEVKRGSDVTSWRRIDISIPGYGNVICLSIPEAEAFSRELSRMVRNAKFARDDIAAPTQPPRREMPEAESKAFVARMATARRRKAQGIETGTAETREAGLGPKDESPVGNADAPGESQ